MATLEIAKFIRHTPRLALENFITSYMPELAEKFTWPANNNDHIASLLGAISESESAHREKLHQHAERFNNMTTDEAQAQLAALVSDPVAFHKLHNAHDRAVTVFLSDPATFRRAEENHYADTHRRGRLWQGFRGPNNKVVFTNKASQDKLIKRLKAIYGDHLKFIIEIYKRERPGSDGIMQTLEQAVIYREGNPQSIYEVGTDTLLPKTIRPACEIIVAYNPNTGDIEVIAEKPDIRKELAKCFSETLLNTTIDAVNLPHKLYDLSSLAQTRSFESDPEDGIIKVEVTAIKLKPFDKGSSVTIEVPRNSDISVYKQAKEWFEENTPFSKDFVVQSAKLVVYFAPLPDEKRGKTLPIKISMPDSCDLKDRTEKDRLIGGKYLQRWGLLQSKT